MLFSMMFLLGFHCIIVIGLVHNGLVGFWWCWRLWVVYAFWWGFDLDCIENKMKGRKMNGNTHTHA
jgi:hypothetical protein